MKMVGSYQEKLFSGLKDVVVIVAVSGHFSTTQHLIIFV